MTRYIPNQNIAQTSVVISSTEIELLQSMPFLIVTMIVIETFALR